MKAQICFLALLIAAVAALKNPCDADSALKTCTVATDCGWNSYCVEPEPDAPKVCMLYGQGTLKCNETCTTSMQCSAGMQAQSGADRRDSCHYNIDIGGLKDEGCPCAAANECKSQDCSASNVCAPAKRRFDAVCAPGAADVCASGGCITWGTVSRCMELGVNDSCSFSATGITGCGAGLRCISGQCQKAIAAGEVCERAPSTMSGGGGGHPVISNSVPCAVGLDCIRVSATESRCIRPGSMDVAGACYDVSSHYSKVCRPWLACIDSMCQEEMHDCNETRSMDNCECGDFAMPQCGVNGEPVCKDVFDRSDWVNTWAAAENCMRAYDLSPYDQWLRSVNPLNPNVNGWNNCLGELTELVCKGYYTEWAHLFDCNARRPRTFNQVGAKMCGHETTDDLLCPGAFSSASVLHVSLFLLTLTALLALLF